MTPRVAPGTVGRVNDADLRVRVLGPLLVQRGQNILSMPQSKKTRALLAYLAITGRVHRRDRLCALLWDVADDPRGALRWSLSKIRSLVDSEDARLLVADRQNVELSLGPSTLDLAEVRLALRAGAEALSVERLVELAGIFRGELLEGLDLIDFDAFNAWCAAEREQARAMQCKVLGNLVERLQDEPAQALDYARELVQIDPLDEMQRARLIRLLGAAGHRQEAMTQYESAQRLLKDLGQATGALDRAWRALEGPGLFSAKTDAPSGAPGLEPSLAAAPDRGASTASAVARPTLVGREEERARLLSVLGDAAGQGRFRALLLKGESGIGKTTLLRDLSQEARRRGCMVLEGAAFEAESGRPYGPWIDALRRLPRENWSDEICAALTPLLPELGRSGAGGPSSRDLLFDAVSQVVSSQARPDRPFLLIFDDLHWCDDASAELLHYVARMTRELPVAMVLGARDGELVDNESAVRVLRSLRRDQILDERLLLPLSQADTMALVHQMGGDSHAEDVFHQSGGNPLLTVELARTAADHSGFVPGTLKELVGDRLARLSPASEDLLRWAAILGTSFQVSRLASLVSFELDALIHALSELERHALLEESSSEGGGGYAFRHALVHRVVYSGLSEPRRRLMHLRVAQQLQKQADPDGSLAVELAQHASLGGDAVTAARACVMAAHRCLLVFAGAEAYMHARRGLHYAETLSDAERLPLRLELMRLKVLARAPEDRRMEAARIEALAEAALDAGFPEHARLGFSTVSYLRWESGAVGDARRTSLRAEFATRGADDESRLLGVAEAARCLVILEKDLPEAEALLLEARAVSERSGQASWAASDGLGLLRMHGGELDEAEQAFKDAWALARQAREHHQEFYSLEHLVQLSLLRGEQERAAGYARELAVIGDKLREGSEAPVARALLALCHYRAGAADSLGTLEDAIVRLREVDAKQRLSFVLTQLALLELERGELERAQARTAEALELAEALEQASEVALARALLLRIARLQKNEAEVERHRKALTQLRGYAHHVRTVVERELQQLEAES